MADRYNDLCIWIVEALEANKGAARIPEIAKHIWENHEDHLKDSGDLFYTWQYDMRWAGKKLVDQGRLDKITIKGQWRLLNC